MIYRPHRYWRSFFLAVALTSDSLPWFGVVGPGSLSSASEKAVKPAASFLVSEPCDKDLVPYARRSMQNYMVLAPSPFQSDMYRAAFWCLGVPPSVGHANWDWGDCTARAVEAWLGVRRMTGDGEFGRTVEQGQRKLLLWLLVPDTGMPHQPNSSRPDKGTYYYDGWDQGRTLRALVRWWLATGDAVEQRMLAAKIHKMIGSLERLATKQVDPRWGPTARFPHQVLDNGKPRDGFSGESSGGQLIEPLAMYWPACRDPSLRTFTDALCNGALADFGPDGSFGGHFSTKASNALGLAKHGVALVRHGDRDRGLRLLKLAKMVYDWTLSPANVNQASTFGWFPENLVGGKEARTSTETCCTADMIELAAVLAGAADLDPALSAWDGLWDHVERYTFNTILPSQFVVTPAYAELIAKRGGDLKIARRFVGGWAGVHSANDWVTRDFADGRLEMLVAGCCAYSGPRALVACWESAIDDDGTRLVARLPVARQTPAASQTVAEGPNEVRQSLRLAADRDVRVRIPDWAAIDRVVARGRDNAKHAPTLEGRYLNFGRLRKEAEVIVTYPLQSRTTVERVGGDSDREDRTPADRKRIYTVHWKGNRVVSMQPAGRWLRIFPDPCEK